MKMKVAKLIPFGIGLLTLAGFVGSLSGSLAWWAYSTRTKVEFQGTSVNVSEKLQIGLKLVNFTQAEVEELIATGLEEDESLRDGDVRYVFTPERYGGGLPAETIQTYLRLQGEYSVNSLIPITSRTYESGPIVGDVYYVTSLSKYQVLSDDWGDLDTVATEGDLPTNPFNYDVYYISSTDTIKQFNGVNWVRISSKGTVATEGDLPQAQEFHLYDTVTRQIYCNTNYAETYKYVKIPFVFRILKINGSVGDKYASNRKIYLSDVTAEAASSNPGSKVGKAIRMYFDNGTAANHIIVNPGDTTTMDVANMYTYVAGILDLDGDRRYDYYPYNDANANKEIIYGDYTGSGTNTFTPASEPATMSNINGVAGDIDLADFEANHSTFLAGHCREKVCYNDYTGITRGVARYRSINNISPDSSRPKLAGGLPLCETGGDAEHYISELTMTMWLEGWDHNCEDKIISHAFNVGVTFQIDSLD